MMPNDIPNYPLTPEEKETLEKIRNGGPHILDSGDRTQFESGAVRDMREGKGRCDLMPLRVIAKCWRYFGEGDELDESEAMVFSYIADFQDTGDTTYLLRALNYFQGYNSWQSMFLEVAKHFEEGAKKYGESNWQKGIPVHCYIDSAVRHYLKWLRGDKDEPHDRAFVWNLMCCIWEVDYSPRAKGAEMKSADFLEKHLNIPEENPDKWVRLEDCPTGLFEFSGKVYLKAGSTVVRVNTGTVEPLHPDILVWPITIEEDGDEVQ